jgi:hypothetical protein
VQRIERILFCRRAAALAAAVWVAIILGCMSISIGGRQITTGTHQDGAFVQEGKVHVGPGCEQVVYYPIPYCSAPNLEIDSCLHQCVVLEQREDHFRLVNNGVLPRTVDWTARGVRAAPVGPPPAPPPTLPPPRPLPIDKE